MFCLHKHVVTSDISIFPQIHVVFPKKKHERWNKSHCNGSRIFFQLPEQSSTELQVEL